MHAVHSGFGLYLVPPIIGQLKKHWVAGVGVGDDVPHLLQEKLSDFTMSLHVSCQDTP